MPATNLGTFCGHCRGAGVRFMGTGLEAIGSGGTIRLEKNCTQAIAAIATLNLKEFKVHSSGYLSGPPNR